MTDEILLKAIKLLESLAEPCYAEVDHEWRVCRRCMAIRQFDFAPDVTRILVDRVLLSLRQSNAGESRLRDLLIAIERALPAMATVGLISHLHGVTYQGPSFGAEMNAAREHLGMPPLGPVQS